MPNMYKLRGTIIGKGYSTEEVAAKIGISRSSLYRKIADDGRSFSIKEADAIRKLLGLSWQDTFAIFFD